jgi:hypothetical protein
MDSPVDDVILGIIKGAIPGDADDKVIDKVKSVVEKWLPKVLLELQVIDAVSGMDNVNDQLNAILAKIKLASNETQNIIWHGLASLILEKLSDGEISWADSVAISEYAFQNIINKKSMSV